MADHYLAILARNSEGELFATVPDLPGVNVTGEAESEVLALAKEFADDYVRDLVEEGHAVPKPRSYEQLLNDESRDKSEMTRAFIPVEVPGKSLKISLSIDEALLARADKAAEDEGLTRSGFIAAAINTRLRARTATSAAGSGDMHSSLRRGFSLAAAHYRAEPGPDVDYVPLMLTENAEGQLVASVPVRRGRRQRSSGAMPKKG
jgi:predicted RNase H-like HicB family nuclease